MASTSGIESSMAFRLSACMHEDRSDYVRREVGHRQNIPARRARVPARRVRVAGYQATVGTW
jgi:hypothetical protein